MNLNIIFHLINKCYYLIIKKYMAYNDLFKTYINYLPNY